MMKKEQETTPQETDASNIELAKTSPQKQQVGKFTRGDHMIHLLVQKGKKFVSPDDSDSTVSIIIQVECGGKTEYTAVRDDVPVKSDSEVHWGQHIFFDLKHLEPDNAKKMQVVIKVLNRGYLKNDMIGMMMFDLSSVYYKQEHKIEHVWCALQNQDSEKIDQIKGLLKMSCAVTGPGDNAIKLEEQTGLEPPDMKIFQAAELKRNFQQLKIRIVEARNMPEFGTFSKTLEAYLKCTYQGGNPMRTKIVTQHKQRCQFMQEFFVPISTPVICERLTLEVFDSNALSDYQIGSLVLNVKKMIKQGRKPGGFFIWENIYGSPPEIFNAQCDLMDKNPEVATQWKGSVLLHIVSESTENPRKMIQPVAPVVLEQATQAGFMDQERYEAMIEIGQGLTLPGEGQKYKVKVAVGDYSWTTDHPKEVKGGYNRWSERVKKPFHFSLNFNPYSDLTTEQKHKEMAKRYRKEQQVFVYLMDSSDKPISYWRTPLCHFKNPNPTYQWIQMKADKAVGKLEHDHDAGILSLKMSVVKLGQNSPPNYALAESWKSPPPRRIGSFKVRCYLFQCRDIPSADTDGTSDPFIKIWTMDEQQCYTSVIEDNLNPIFMECKEIIFDCASLREAPPIILSLFDADVGLISDSSDYLGRAVIYLDQANVSPNDSIPIPKWHDIKFGVLPDSPSCGQILCSFAVVDSDYKFETPEMHIDLDKMVEKKEFNVKINCLALRELQSNGLLPVQKAYIQFMVRSLTDPRFSGQLQNVRTNPKHIGPNPNLNTVVQFKIPLPLDPLYCPTLSCTVYDQVFIGLSQPILGSFSIPIGHIMHEIHAKRAKVLRKATHFRDQLLKLCTSDRLDNFLQILKMPDEDENGNSEDKAVDLNQIKLLSVEKEQAPLRLGRNNLPDDSDEFNDESQLIQPNNRQGQDNQDEASNNPQFDKNARSELRLKEKQQKTQHAIQRKIQKAVAQKIVQTVDSSGNIALPNYVLDPDLAVYREVEPPKNNIFKAVGYDSQEQIRAIMKLKKEEDELTDEVKDRRRRTTISGQSFKKRKISQELSKTLAVGIVKKGLKDEKVKKQDEFADKAIGLLDQIVTQSNRHYRLYLEDELENIQSIFPENPFHSFQLVKGQSRGVEKSLFGSLFGQGADNEDESGQASTKQNVGRFKGLVEVSNAEEKQEYVQKKEELVAEIFQLLSKLHNKALKTDREFTYEDFVSPEDRQHFEKVCEMMRIKVPGFTDFMSNLCFEEGINLILSKKTAALVRLYLLQGYQFAQRDFDSPSDPYLIIKFGEHVYNGRDEYQNDEPNPVFMQRHDFSCEFPGSPPLIIEAWDYDLLFGDDLIGATTVDLDDRFFNPTWQTMDEKPIECRELYIPSSSANQGILEMWLDIDPVSKLSEAGKVWDLVQEPKDEFEVRLAIYGCKNVPAEDIEGTSDVFIKAQIGDGDRQESDTHYRCSTGLPSFNYRMKFDVQTPMKSRQVLKLQSWDRDLLKSNDMICQWDLDLTEMVKDTMLKGDMIHLNRGYFDRSLKRRIQMENEEDILEFVRDKRTGDTNSTFRLKSYHVKDEEKCKPIYIDLDLRIVKKDFALKNKVGQAREEPNQDPHLPEPIGRFKLSLNPLENLKQLVSPSVLRKIQCGLICIICLVITYFVFPLLASFKTLFFV